MCRVWVFCHIWIQFWLIGWEWKWQRNGNEKQDNNRHWTRDGGAFALNRLMAAVGSLPRSCCCRLCRRHRRRRPGGSWSWLSRSCPFQRAIAWFGPLQTQRAIDKIGTSQHFETWLANYFSSGSDFIRRTRQYNSKGDMWKWTWAPIFWNISIAYNKKKTIAIFVSLLIFFFYKSLYFKPGTHRPGWLHSPWVWHFTVFLPITRKPGSQ